MENFISFSLIQGVKLLLKSVKFTSQKLMLTTLNNRDVNLTFAEISKSKPTFQNKKL